MTTLRKLAAGLLFSLGLILIVPHAASAMTVDQPTGTLVNGWYKDSFSIAVHYGNGSCTGPGTANTYIYHSSSAYEGTHQYYFMSDVMDNPYYSVDGTPPQPLVLPLPCPTGTTSGYLPNAQYKISLDTQAPMVSITSPPGNTTTSAATYDISGVASDGMGSGVQGVQLIVNGSGGSVTPVSAGTFTLTASLAAGDNAIQVKAFDGVGHSSTSNTVVITRSSSGGGTTSGGGSSGGSTSGSGSSSNTSSSASSNAVSSSPPSTGTLKFLNGAPITLNGSALDRPSDPSVVLAETGFPKVNGLLMGVLIAVALALALANVLVIWRFRPVFARLDRGNSGLRRRIIIIVTLPSLVPVFGIGFLAYHQLSASLEAALSQELARAAQTSSIKLEREFAIRHDVITTNSGDIFQIQSQFNTQYGHLASQKDACTKLITAGKTSQVSTDDNCLPFLAVLGQLGTASSAQYQSALTDAYNNSLHGLQADEQQRTDALLASIRAYFPDVTELALIDASSPAKIVASLPAAGTVHPVLADHGSLLAGATKESTTLFDASRKPGQAIFTYPITDAKGSLQGQAVVAFNTEAAAFVPAIWQATPKPYAVDKAYFLSNTGTQIYPRGSDVSATQAKRITSSDAGSLVNLTAGHGEKLATRVSPVTGTGWTVAVGAPPASILAPVANVQRVALLAITSFLLLSLLLGILFVSSIATEIEALYQGAVRFAKGELDYAIALPSHDELRALGDTMNQMAQDIKTAQAALVEKDKEFINITSHELKAPMTAILGNLSMIIDDGMGAVDATARGLVEQAYRGTQRLKTLVTDMLDVARLEAGKTQFNLVPVDITQLAKDIVAMQAVPAQQASVGLAYEPAGNLPHVLADDSKLQIILTNFVSNAIKYNRQNGTVTVTHELKDGALQTAIADTGLGIPDDQKEHIFEKYYRVQHQDRANVPGTGLGMYITKCYIEAMGGKVWFESVHGQGTTFFFTLPLVQSMPPATADTIEMPRK